MGNRALDRWSNRMLNNSMAKSEQHYLQTRLAGLPPGSLLLLGNHRQLSWLPLHGLSACQLVCQPSSIDQIVTDFATLPIRSESIEAVVMPYLLDDGIDIKNLLSEVFRLLVPEGKLWLLGWHYWHPWNWRYASSAPCPQSLGEIKHHLVQAAFTVKQTHWLYYGTIYGIEVHKKVITRIPIKPKWTAYWQSTPVVNPL